MKQKIFDNTSSRFTKMCMVSKYSLAMSATRELSMILENLTLYSVQCYITRIFRNRYITIYCFPHGIMDRRNSFETRGRGICNKDCYSFGNSEVLTRDAIFLQHLAHLAINISLKRKLQIFLDSLVYQSIILSTTKLHSISLKPRKPGIQFYRSMKGQNVNRE